MQEVKDNQVRGELLVWHTEEMIQLHAIHAEIPVKDVELYDLFPEDDPNAWDNIHDRVQERWRLQLGDSYDPLEHYALILEEAKAEFERITGQTWG